MTNSSDDKIRSFCNGCRQNTWHDVVVSKSRKRSEGDGQFPRVVNEQWQMLQCCGCEAIKVFVKEESIDFKTPNETHYPAKQIRQMPNWCDKVPTNCQDLFREIYSAKHAGCITLSAMGTRTIVDQILLEMLEDVGGFEQKLQEAVSRGFFTEEQKNIISVAIDAGSAAAHRGFRPTEEQLESVLNIVEHTLIGHYELAALSGRLKKEIPPRESRKG